MSFWGKKEEQTRNTYFRLMVQSRINVEVWASDPGTGAMCLGVCEGQLWVKASACNPKLLVTPDLLIFSSLGAAFPFSCQTLTTLVHEIFGSGCFPELEFFSPLMLEREYRVSHFLGRMEFCSQEALPCQRHGCLHSDHTSIRPK